MRDDKRDDDDPGDTKLVPEPNQLCDGHPGEDEDKRETV